MKGGFPHLCSAVYLALLASPEQQGRCQRGRWLGPLLAHPYPFLHSHRRPIGTKWVYLLLHICSKGNSSLRVPLCYATRTSSFAAVSHGWYDRSKDSE